MGSWAADTPLFIRLFSSLFLGCFTQWCCEHVCASVVDSVTHVCMCSGFFRVYTSIVIDRRVHMYRTLLQVCASVVESVSHGPGGQSRSGIAGSCDFGWRAA